MILQRSIHNDRRRAAVYGLVVSDVLLPDITVTVTNEQTGDAYTVPVSQIGVGTGSDGDACEDRCVNAGFNSRGTLGCCGKPSCSMGCQLARQAKKYAATAANATATCKAMCNQSTADGCSSTFFDTPFQTCSGCPLNGGGCPGSPAVCEAGCEFGAPAVAARAWKAFLKPTPAVPGATYRVEATCTSGCVGYPGGGASLSVSLARVKFGDVYVCSGQSNMALGFHYSFMNPELTKAAQHGRYDDVHIFMMGDMGTQYPAVGPAYATTAGGPQPCRHGSQYGNISACEKFHGAFAGSGRWANLTWAARQPQPVPPPRSEAEAAAMARAKAPPAFSAVTPVGDPPQPIPNLLNTFSATCLYFATSLRDQLAEESTSGADEHNNVSPAPIGLIQSAIGGSKIEAWMSNETLSTCRNESMVVDGVISPPSRLYYGMITPFVNMTVTGFLWYQGENNCGNVMGNSAAGMGYGCELPALVRDWRRVWSREPHTTDPLAPFGVVTLAAGGSEGFGQNMSDMRWSQTGNMGVLPNKRMPNTFLAQAFDLGDPWEFNPSTWSNNCSRFVPNTTHHSPKCARFPPAKEWNKALRPVRKLIQENNAPGFMGGIHPRIKSEVGRRLAFAAKNLLHGGRGALSGPVLAGCTLARPTKPSKHHREKPQPWTLEIRFDRAFLRKDRVAVQPSFDYNMSRWGTNDASSMMVCVGAPGNATAQRLCAGTGQNYSSGALSGGWRSAPVVAIRGKKGEAAVAVDLAPVVAAFKAAAPPNATFPGVVAVRYGWPLTGAGDTCCPFTPQTQGWAACVPGSCPILGAQSQLPANPWFANIDEGGRCRCLAPQTCNH